MNSTIEKIYNLINFNSSTMINYSQPIDIRERNTISLDQVIVPEWAKKDIKEILISEGELNSRVRKMSLEICDFYKQGNLYVLTVLKGAVPFFTNLLFNEQVSIPFIYDFITASSYKKGTTSNGDPIIKLSPKTKKEILKKNVLVVEDIIDSGLTLERIITKIKNYKPQSVEVCALLDKKDRRVIPVDAKFIGFSIPNEFVVGYGLDFNGNYRNIQHICVLKPEIYTK